MKLSDLSDLTLAQASAISEVARLQREVQEPWRKLGLDRTAYEAMMGTTGSMASEVDRMLGADSLGAMRDVLSKLNGISALAEARQHLGASDIIEQQLRDFSTMSSALGEVERTRNLFPVQPATEFLPPPDFAGPHREARGREKRRLEIAEEQLRLQQEANKVLIDARDAETARADRADRKAAFASRIAVWSLIATLVTGGGAIWLTLADKL